MIFHTCRDMDTHAYSLATACTTTTVLFYTVYCFTAVKRIEANSTKKANLGSCRHYDNKDCRQERPIFQLIIVFPTVLISSM